MRVSFIHFYIFCSSVAVAVMRGTAVQLVVCLLLWSLMEVHSQTAPYVTFMGETLPRHAYVDLSLLGSSGSNSVQCHTDLVSCCSGTEGAHRGDWYNPNGARLGFSSSPDDIYEHRIAHRVELHRRNNGDTSGIYRCDIETSAVNSPDNTARETVYVGLYVTGGILVL